MFFCSQGFSAWSTVLGTSGFFGQYYLGGLYDNGGYFQGETSIGSYTVGGATRWQLNTMFRGIVFEHTWDAVQWKALTLGAGFVYALIDLKSNKYFSRSPREYPDSGYYEQTALRGVLELSSQIYLKKQNFSLAYSIRVLDRGIVAYNNSTNNDLRFYTSAGLAVIFNF